MQVCVSLSFYKYMCIYMYMYDIYENTCINIFIYSVSDH